MAFGTLLWESVILTSVALLLRDIVGIGSAPRSGPLYYPGLFLLNYEACAKRPVSMIRCRPWSNRLCHLWLFVETGLGSSRKFYEIDPLL